MQIQPGSKLVMIGDSITDAGRVRPIGEGKGEALGKGYVSLVNALLTTVYPDYEIRVINMGTSGNTVRDLENRWQTDVLDLHPDWLSVMIGINDVWRQYDSPLRPDLGVALDEYTATYRRILEVVRPSLKGLVLLTPFYIEPSTSDAMRAKMDEYGVVVQQLASEYDAVFVDTQAAYNAVLAHMYSAALAWDRVHPGIEGHMVLAKAFLNGVGFDWTR
jgi:lysophospholipase L1-like esterase